MAKNNFTPAQSAEFEQKCAQYVQTQEFQSIPKGDRLKALTQFMNALTVQMGGTPTDFGSGIPTGDGFLRPVPGQPGWETTATRVVGAVAGTLLGAEALGIIGGGAAPAAAGTTVLEDGTVVSTGAGAAGAGGAGAAGAGGPGGGAAVTHAGLSFGTAQLLNTGVQLFGSLFANHTASEASKHAADVEAQAAREALDYTKQHDAQQRADEIVAQKANYDQYVAKENRLAPYRGVGEAANNELAYRLGLTPVAQPAPPPPPTFSTVTPPPAAASTGGLHDLLPGGTPAATPPPAPSIPAPTATTSSAATLVTMRAPNGGTKQVPSDQVPHYQGLGATVVN